VIRDRSLAKAREELLALLPDLIRPQVTVRDLMSWGVRTVDAREQAAHAAEMMRRSGHEGYPVVENGRVIGLLTRHAVDRAMDHGMEHLPVEQLMNSGAITVTPDDSLETLQHIMSGMGWGQVPVTDEGGRILGVVTRTDLLNHLANHRTNGTSRREIVRLLQTALPAGMWSLVKEMAELAQEIGLGLYFVGGFVRDLLLEIPNNDLDLVVEGDAIHLAHALAERFSGEIHTHEQFGTAKWTPDDKTAARFPGVTDTIDFVTARSEFYERPTALPTVEQGSIKLDLHRRDFTINTLAVRLSPEPLGRLLDFWGGERDLQEGIIRVLHSLSFIDDPTRMLRAVRFEQRLDFTIEPRTLDLIKNALPLLNRVSGERIRREIALIFREQNPLPALNRLDSLGILRQIHPALYVDGRLNAAVRALEDARRDPPWPAAFEDTALPYFILLTCRLDEATVELIMERLRFNRDAIEAAQASSRLYPWITAWDPTRKPSEIAAKLDKLPDSVLLACWAMAVSDAARDAVTRYALEWRHVRPIAGGHAIQERGLKPGPAYSDLLGALRDAWLNGEITSEEEERALLEEMIAQLKSL
jgi:tRNA nucleotidyltransferase (CCA-adding enzyme)